MRYISLQDLRTEEPHYDHEMPDKERIADHETAYYYLYVLLDIFSRYVVGWLLARQEAATLAKVLTPRVASVSTSPPTSSSFMPTAAPR